MGSNSSYALLVSPIETSPDTRERQKKRIPARVKQPLTVPVAANLCWSLDFTSDVLTDGRRFRTLNVLDDYNRQLLGVEIDF